MLSATERIFLQRPEDFEKEYGIKYVKKIRSVIRKKFLLTAIDIMLMAEYDLKHEHEAINSGKIKGLVSHKLLSNGFRNFFQDGMDGIPKSERLIDQLRQSIITSISLSGQKEKKFNIPNSLLDEERQKLIDSFERFKGQKPQLSKETYPYKKK